MAAPAADGGGWRRMEAVVAYGGDGGGWRRRYGDRTGGRGGSRVDGYIMMWLYRTYSTSTTQFPAVSRFKLDRLEITNNWFFKYVCFKLGIHRI